MTRSLAAALLALLVAGCDAQGSLLGEFEGRDEVAGLDRRVTGEAVYTVVETASGPVFVLGLFVGDLYESDVDAYDYVLFRRPGRRLGVGAYPVDDDAEAVAATLARVRDADDPRESEGRVLRGVDGTLAVTRVDGYGFLAGTYAFSAEGLAVERPSRRLTGSASGTFEARYEPPATFRHLGLAL